MFIASLHIINKTVITFRPRHCPRGFCKGNIDTDYQNKIYSLILISDYRKIFLNRFIIYRDIIPYKWNEPLLYISIQKFSLNGIYIIIMMIDSWFYYQHRLLSIYCKY